MKRALMLPIAVAGLAAASLPDGAANGGPPQVRVGLAVQQTSVVIGSRGAFAVFAGEQQLTGAGQTWRVFLPSAVPAQAQEQPRAGEIYVLRADGTGGWYGLPLRARPAAGGNAELTAGPDEKSLRRYGGELEVARDASGMLSLVNVVDLESYTRGVVCGEISARYPAEALKAQAVAARSMALASLGRHRADGFDLCAEGHCQAYVGLCDEPQIAAAVEATRGQVVTYDGRPIDAVYHANCGGHTDSSRDIWGGADVPYLRGVSDLVNGRAADYSKDDARLRAYLTGAPAAYCRQADLEDWAHFRWVRTLTRAQIEKSLADMVNVGEVTDLRPLQRGVSGRIIRLEVSGTRGKTTLSPELVIRQALGRLPSSAFVVDRYCDDGGRAVVFVLWGAGWGHGVGMCQAGAAGMAQAGLGYRAILAKYYPGTQIETIY
jgi:SpoIID/LytB domain protein